MTNEEFNLSDKSVNVDKNTMFFDTDVKEFIRRLKEWVYEQESYEGYFCGEEGDRMREEIDKLAGEKLI